MWSCVLAGCSSIPAYERPDPGVASTYPVAGAPGPLEQGGAANALPAPELPWRSFFADERLRGLIQSALQYNRDLQLAVLNIERSRAQLGIVSADRLPTLNLSGSILRQQATGSDGESVVSSLSSLGLGITAYEIDFFGRVRSLTEAARAQYLATEASRRVVQITLIADVANTYLAWLASDELLLLTQRTLKSREESLRLTRLKMSLGAGSKLELNQAESLVEQARATLAQIQRQKAQAENALVLLIGQPLPPGLPPPRKLAEPELLQPVRAGLPSELLIRRPDVLLAEQNLIAAHANIGVARAAMFPRISLTATLGVVSPELSRLLGGGDSAWSLAPQMTWPVFDSGRSRLGVELAEANQRIAAAQYQKTVQLAFREVADALSGLSTLTIQREALEAQSRTEAQRVQLVDLRHRSGAASYLDVLDAQRSLFAVQQSAVQARLAELQNQVVLYKALGGGWQDSEDR